MNTLYYGDNLEVMRALDAKSIHLIYLDPPFNSKANYAVSSRKERGEREGEKGRDTIENEAFRDVWVWSARYEELYQDILDPKASKDPQTQASLCVIQGIRDIIGTGGMLAYLVYMQPRLVQMKRILKSTGSLYLHCDPTASHYLRIMMDAIFGMKNFRNEVVWWYGGGGAGKKQWGKKHDVILFYTKGDTYTFNADEVREPYKWTAGQKRADGSERDLTKGKLPDDVFHMHGVLPWAKEYLGYPTQKPLPLLSRIIKASSKPGDIVLDPFCGGGTTLEASHRLGRQCIGIDISYLSIDTTFKRLQHTFGNNQEETQAFSLQVKGCPTHLGEAEKLLIKTLERTYDRKIVDLDEALSLAENEVVHQKIKQEKNAGRFEFQRWVCSLIGATPRDRELQEEGLDGQWVCQGQDKAYTSTCVAVVIKAAKYASVEKLIAFKKRLSTDGTYSAGIFITLYPSYTPEIKRICRDFENPYWTHCTGHSYPRLQLWSLEEHFKGIRPQLPAPLFG